MKELETFELTNPQKSIWMMEQFYKGTNINNICASLTIKEKIDVEKLNKAINLFIKNNKSFRLNFKIVNEKIEQYFTEIEEIQFELVSLADKREVQKLAKETADELFNIEDKRLFKFKLFTLENGYGGFVVNTHHIISDAATMSLVAKEVVEIYTALIDGEKIQEKEYSYSQFAKEEQEYLKSSKYIKDKEYWNQMYSTIPEVASIPTISNTSPSNITGKSTREKFIINKNLLMKISEFCNQNKISNFNFFMAVYAIYLGRVSNLRDFVIGTPILNRTNFKEKHTTGMFINTAPLRIKIENNIDFISFVKNISQSSMSMLRHQKYTYQMLLEDLRKENNSLPTLYDMILSYQVTKANDRTFKTPYEVEWIPSTTISNGIYVHLHDNDDEGSINIDYDYQIEKYSSEDIQNMHKRILHIIEQVLSNPNGLEKDIDIVTEEEKNKILYEFNDTYSEYPRDKTVVDLFEEQVQKTPDNVAVVFEDEKITYKELNEKANCLANYLVEEGVKKEEPVPVVLNRNIDLIISMIAIIKAGAVYVPISTDFPIDRIKYILKDSGAKLIITSKKSDEDKLDINKIYIDEFNYSKYDDKPINIDIDTNSTLYIIYTSGSTGNPKGVKINHKNLNNFVNAFTNKFEIKNGKERCLASTNIGFDVSIFEFFISLLNGAQLFLYEENSITDIFKYCNEIVKNQISLLYIPPNILEDVYTILSKEKNININKILIGVEPIKGTTIEKYYNLNPKMKIINAYGPTETTICATTNILKRETLNKYNIIPIGKPINNSRIFILDNNFKLLPVGNVGELYISGEAVGNGYLNNPEKNKESFIKIPDLLNNDIIYKTGDLAKWNEDGTISFIGREDNQVKINGHRMELGEIENCIYQYQDIEKAIAVLDQNKKINAYYTAKNNIKISDLKSFMEKKLPQYFIPSKFMQLEKFELTPNGKINKKILPEIKNKEKQIVAPENDTQEMLKEIWEEVLNRKDISITDNFFEMGGDSLTAINVLTKIYSRLNIQITIKDIFENSSIIKLAEIVDAYNEQKYLAHINKTESKDIYQLSTAQERIYYASTMDTEGSILYNISGGIILKQKPNIKKLEDCINKIIEKHSILRTQFELINGKIMQKIVKEQRIELNIEKSSNKNIDEIFSEFVKPFRLLNSKLYRFKLIEVENQEIFFMLDMHHSICDGTSLRIIMRELSELYNGETIDEGKIEYKDFAEWERQNLREGKFKKAERYWMEQFNDGIPNLNLPATYGIQNRTTFLGESEYTEISNKLSGKISKIAKQLNCTTYMVYLAAYYILLSRYSNQKDIVVGTPSSGRYLPELENLVGMFVNTLPIRSKIDTSKTFEEYILELRENCINAIDNQEYPPEEINNKLDTQREDGKRRLYDTMFIFQNNGYPEIDFNGIETEYYLPKQNVSKVDISMEIIPNKKEAFDIRVEYCTELFNKEYVENFANNYLQILQQICENTNIKITNIKILTEKEKSILQCFNSTEEEYSKDKTVIKIFEENARKNPEGIAIIFKNEKITYKELNERANKLAKYLIQNKVEPNNVLGILLTRSENIIVSMLATLKIGCAYMLIDPSLPNDRIKYMLTDSSVTALITEENVKYIKFKNRIFLENVLDTETGNINISNNIENPFSIIYTSGSTGEPKGVALQNKGVINLVLSHQKILNTDRCNNFLSMSTVSFDMFMVETMVPLLSGKTVILSTEEEQKIPAYTSKLITKNKVDFILTTPSRIELFLDNKLYECLENLKVVQLGGEIFTLELKNRLKKYTRADLYNGYGPTEITACCSMKKVENEISLGRPMNNTQIYILNEDNNICPIGVPGEICVSGDGVSLGYINNKELTSKAFIKNPFGEGDLYKTGDIGKINLKGELKYIDRKDSQIKIRGLRVELSEIEKQILNAIKLKACTVIYKKEKGYISAFILADEKIDTGEVRKKLTQKLPLYMVPKYITQLDKIPITNNGKIDKKLLETYNEEKQPDIVYAEPRNEKEKLFCSIWEKLLNRKIGIDNDVFECGADSLIAIKFKTELLAYDIEVSYADLFKYKTVRSFCKNSIIKDAEDAEQYNYANINKILEKNNIKNLKNIVYNKKNNLLLFGATGFIGMHIIQKFIQNDTGKIYCIVRDKNNKSAQERFVEILHFYFGHTLDKYLGNRIIAIKGNVLKENFELSNRNYKYLKDDVDVVINSVANVKHYGDEKKFIETNVESTQNIIDFCIENDKRLLQISSLSVSGNASLEGNAEERITEEKMSFSETDLYKGQRLSNVYVKSKFKSERIILENIEKGLEAQILRLGNITSRISDGRFQINPEDNAFANKIRSMIRLGAIPEYLRNEYMEFTPVDTCAEAIIKIMQNNEKNYSVYHIYNDNHIYFDKLKTYLEKANIKLDIINQMEFMEKIDKLLKEKNKNILSGIINDFDKNKKLTYNSNIDILSEFTRAVLYKMGFKWPEINEEYIKKYIEYLKEIQFL